MYKAFVIFAALATLASTAPQGFTSSSGLAIPLGLRSVPWFVNANHSINFNAFNGRPASVDPSESTGIKHPFFTKRTEERDNLEQVGLTYDHGIWYGTIHVGTPPRPFTVAFDSGSIGLVLPGHGCSTCGDHTLWDPKSSTTAENLDAPFEFEYKTGSEVSGDIYADNVFIGGYKATFSHICVADSYPDDLHSDNFAADGMMGFSFYSESISDYGVVSVFETLARDDILPLSAFSFKLSNPGAELYVGGSNSELYEGDFTFVPVIDDEPKYWKIKIDNVLSDSEEVMNDLPAVIDTGTYLISGPTGEVSRLFEALHGAPAPAEVGEGYYTLPCGAFPVIHLTLAGVPFRIPVASLDRGTIPGDSSRCIVSIVGSGSDDLFWTIGMVFLENVYTMFDFGRLQIGFAQLTPPPVER